MIKNRIPQSGPFSCRFLFSIAFCLGGLFMAELALTGAPAAIAESPAKKAILGRDERVPKPPTPMSSGPSGSGWSIVMSPNVNTIYGAPNVLSGVTCVSATDCWAVGYSANSGGRSQTLAEHWNGLSWSVVNSPNVSSSEDDEFTTLTCVSSSNCWAVGTRENILTLIEHWDGASWSIVSSPQTGRYLTGVTCTSASDCWAVGISGTGTNPVTLTEHWDGAAWTIIPSPSPSNRSYLVAVNCASANDCWAVGTFEPVQGPYQTLVEHWDGAAWNVVPSISPGIYENGLNDIHCSSSSDCLAVGGYADSVSNHSLIERWDGNSWTLSASQDPPNSGGGYLFSVACNTTSDCWTVGSYANSSGFPKTLAEHWDGNSWSVIASPSRPSSFDNYLYHVACVDATNCWAVGYYEYSATFTLVEKYSLSIPPLTATVSRMTHGDVGTFDINLPLTGASGIECRSSSALGAGNYSVVFSFVNGVTNCGSAGTSGGTVVSGPSSNQCTMNLTGIADTQTISLELDNVVDSQSNTGNVAVPMGVLIGDVSGDGLVNVGDTVLIRNHSGETVTASNCRYDVNTDGVVNVGDTVVVRSHSGDFLP